MTTQIPCTVGDWWVVEPAYSKNFVLNAFAGTTGNFFTRYASVVTRVTTYQYRGLYSYRVETAADDEGTRLVLSALANVVHYATAWVRGRLPSAWQWSLNNTTWRTPKLLRSDNGWFLYGVQFPASEANASVAFRTRQLGGGSGDWYVGATQVEANSNWTDIVDPDRYGCKWNGTAHASTSERSAQSRSGGILRRLNTYFNVNVGTVSGIGMAPIILNTQESAVQPGSLLQSVKVQERPFIITLEPPTVLRKDMHRIRKGVVNIVKHDLVSPLQPVRLRYTGTDKELEIAATYDSGLGAQFEPFLPEKIPVGFIAHDPYFYELPQSAASLTTKLSVANANRVIKRIDGVWSNISSQFNGIVYCFAVGPDDSLYVGGNFTNVGDANGDYIVKVAPDGTISSLGTGMSGGTGSVYALAIGPDGSLYAGGDFTLAGGVANTAYVAKWNGAAWTPLGTGMNGSVSALCFGSDGTLYAGGSFALAGGVANTAYVAKWNGTVWVPLSTGLATTVYALAIGLDGTLYAGGSFTNFGDANGDGIVKWNGTAWSSMRTGANNTVRSIVVGPDGNIYAGGYFTLAGGVSNTAYVAKWNGSAWSALSTGMNNLVYTLAISPDGSLYAGGIFTTAGGLSLSDKIAVWNGSIWSHVDVDLPGNPTIFSILTPSAAKCYIGYSTDGTAYTSDTTTLTNNGSTDVYPKLIIKRSGGTSATVQWLENETTGKTIWFNYALLDGETLTVNFTAKTITSSMFGNVIGRALLPGSEFSTWRLQNGANSISLYISDAGGPTLTAYLLWYNAHSSADGAA